MSGEGLSVSFRRTPMTQKSNKELLREFQKIVYASPVTKQMKWYGNDHSVEMMEHGDEELAKWQQEAVAIKDTFEFTISVYESWHDDADLYESHDREDSFVSLAREFAHNNRLMYFPDGFPAEWIEQEIIDGEKHWNHFIVQPDDKNIDKICEVWHSYGLAKIKDDSKELWYKARDKVKQLMEKKYEYSS
ncbi:MAG: hypothetical protein HOC66_03040 [Flavobacteriales bacterium]|nr:hypothetical protein [Flavobacteriales bacterium]